jgi:hypothetical protein
MSELVHGTKDNKKNLFSSHFLPNILATIFKAKTNKL